MKYHGTQLTSDMIVPREHINPAYHRLEQTVSNCHKCVGMNIPKCTDVAPGYGAVPAELMVVGQSLHGYNAATPDRQIPFVGPVQANDSGILLYKILRKAGYTFTDGNLFVTNIVKCHPPRNRSSTREEIDNCHPYLRKEIALVKPKIILLVGADARREFKIPNLRADAQPLSSYVRYYKHRHAKKRLVPLAVYYVAILHPSAILRFYGSDKVKQYMYDCVACIQHVRRICG